MIKLALITGMSGAGKSVALKTLEDAGYEAIDNIPLPLLPSVIDGGHVGNCLAVGVDIRNQLFKADQFLRSVAELKANGLVELTVIYLDCDDEVLQRRYTETRRTHPLARDRTVLDGIEQERRLIGTIKEHADISIDTSDTKAADLRRIIQGHVAAAEDSLTVHVMSFSFKKGVPREADSVIDVRFLKNPHYVEALQPLTGQNQRVGEYIESDAHFANFFDRLCLLMLPLLPRYKEEGKNYFTLAIGCTGGKHRSVYVAEKITERINTEGVHASLRHRDMPVV